MLKGGEKIKLCSLGPVHPNNNLTIAGQWGENWDNGTGWAATGPAAILTNLTDS